MNPIQTMVSALLIASSVFMGFQVDRWWEERREQQIENQYLGRLIEDLKTDQEQLNSRLNYFTNVKDSGLIALDYLQEQPASKNERAVSLAAFYMSSQAWEFTPASGTFEELKSSGALSLIRDVELRKALADYYQSLVNANYVWRTPNYYRRTIRSLIPPQTQRALWDACHRMERQGSNQSFSSNCRSVISSGEVDAILARIVDSEQVKLDLNFMMSNVDISLELFRSHLNLSDEVITQLSEAFVEGKPEG